MCSAVVDAVIDVVDERHTRRRDSIRSTHRRHVVISRSLSESQVTPKNGRRESYALLLLITLTAQSRACQTRRPPPPPPPQPPSEETKRKEI